MAVLSRAALLTKLNSIINDNNFGDVEPSEVREVLIDIRDSALWNDEGVNRAVTANLTAGYTTTPFSLGTGSGTVTPVYANGNLQVITNSGAFTLAAPSGSGSLLIEVTNVTGAGAITFSGFKSVTGATYNTTPGNEFLFSIARFNGAPWLSIISASGNV